LKTGCRINTPTASTFRRRLFLASDRFARSLAGPRIGLGALSMSRKSANVTGSPITLDIHQALNIQLNFTPQVTLNFEVGVLDDRTDPADLLLGQVPGSRVRTYIRLTQYKPGNIRTDTINVSQTYLDPFVPGNVDTCNASQ